MRVLIVKTSALGDIVHCLPALNMARALLPECDWHWLTRPMYTSLVTMHPALATALQQPRPLAALKALRGTDGRAAAKYDLIIDAQGLMRSALVGRLYRGKFVGYHRSSAREKPASLFYQQSYRVSAAKHAVYRNCALIQQALGLNAKQPWGAYGLETEPNKTKRLALVTNASSASKRWKLEGWRELIKLITRSGYQVWLPWGNAAEHQKCQQLAQTAPELCLVPSARMDFPELADELTTCCGLIGLDTGISHLGAALGLPVLGLYFNTAPELCGVWSPRALNLKLVTQRLNKHQSRIWPRVDPKENYHGHLRIATRAQFHAPELWQCWQGLQQVPRLTAPAPN